MNKLKVLLIILMNIPVLGFSQFFDISGTGISYVSENFGIGTAAPSEKLTVAGNIRLENFEAIIGHSGNPLNFVKFLSNNHSFLSSDRFISLQTGGSDRVFITRDEVRFLPDGTERMRIDDVGLGIGTTSPSSSLDVQKFVTGIPETVYEMVKLKFNTDDMKNNLGAYISLEGQDGNNGGANFGRIQWQNVSDGNEVSGKLSFWTADNSGVITNAMTMNELQNVGIGTDSPSSKLQVSGGDVYIEDVSSGVIMKSPNGNCWRMTVDNSGGLVISSTPCP